MSLLLSLQGGGGATYNETVGMGVTTLSSLVGPLTLAGACALGAQGSMPPNSAWTGAGVATMSAAGATQPLSTLQMDSAMSLAGWSVLNQPTQLTGVSVSSMSTSGAIAPGSQWNGNVPVALGASAFLERIVSFWIAENTSLDTSTLALLQAALGVPATSSFEHGTILSSESEWDGTGTCSLAPTSQMASDSVLEGQATATFTTRYELTPETLLEVVGALNLLQQAVASTDANGLIEALQELQASGAVDAGSTGSFHHQSSLAVIASALSGALNTQSESLVLQALGTYWNAPEAGVLKDGVLIPPLMILMALAIGKRVAAGASHNTLQFGRLDSGALILPRIMIPQMINRVFTQE